MSEPEIMSKPDVPETKRVSMRLECDLDAPIEKVWRAFSEPALLAQWLIPAEAGERETIRCEILASEPHRFLRFRWQAKEPKSDGTIDELDTVVTFELEPAPGGGTHLRLVHDGFVVPAEYPVDIAAEEPEILVYLPLQAIARRRLRRPRRAVFVRGALPTVMRLAA